MAGKSVLVVDDNPDIVAIIVQVLLDEGFEPISAANGQEGLYIFRREQPALILVDLQMPIMTGQEMLQHIREEAGDEGEDVPVIIVSAHPHIKREAARTGATEYLHKPFEIDDLVSKVRSLVH
ncbi:MAG: response regulator [Chloroflexota bacterium]